MGQDPHHIISNDKIKTNMLLKIITRLFHHIVLFRFSRTQDEDWEDDEDELW